VPEVFFDLDQGVSRLWFRSELVSPKHIDSMAILAAARIPVQMEFLVGTGIDTPPRLVGL
jgi:hypothetical protein